MQPRGRKSELKGDARQKDLLNILKALLKNGVSFSDLSVEGLAKEAGMSRPTFYFYFESKQQALAVALTEVRSDMKQHADILFEGNHEDPLNELALGLQGIVNTWYKERHLMRALVEGSATDATLWKLLEEFVNFFVEPAAQSMMEIRKKQGQILSHKSATELATALIWSNERNMYRATVSNFSKKEWDNLVVTLTEIWAGTILNSHNS